MKRTMTGASAHVILGLVISGLAIGGYASLASAQTAPKPKPATPAAPAAPAPAAPAGGAPAAAAPTTAPSNIVQLKPDSTQPDWLKACGKDEAQNKKICYTTRDFVAENNQPILAAAVYDVVGDPKKFVRFLMPLGFMIQPGIRFSVDNGAAVPGKFSMCLPNGCFAEAESNSAFLDTMKKGTNIKIQVLNQVGQEVTLLVPLAGFGKAFDGAEVDPAALEAQQKKIAEELAKRQGGGAPAPVPVPAPGAPAIPAAPAAPAVPAAPKP